MNQHSPDLRIPSPSTRRQSRAVALTAAVCVAIAACGTSGRSSVTPADGGPALEYVKCLRSHGVPNFPDPMPGGRLPNVPSNIDTQAPAFRSAQRACAEQMPGGSGPGASAESEKLQLVSLARCIRAHGLPSFPDPTSSPPPPGSHTGNVIGIGGVYLALPPQSPALKRAAAACGFRSS